MIVQGGKGHRAWIFRTALADQAIGLPGNRRWGPGMGSPMQRNALPGTIAPPHQRYQRGDLKTQQYYLLTS